MIENKSTVYNGPTLYNGDGRVYNGHGVYNDGGGKYNVIGGREYKTVIMPDGKEWLSENLDYKFNGVDIGPAGYPTTPAAWYYNNDESLYGIDNERHCGLLYNWYATKLLNDNKDSLCPGWHVPTSDEWESLFTSIGGTSYAGQKLKAASVSWAPSWNGQDIYQFAVLPGGYKYDSSFYYAGTWVQYNTMTESDANYFKYVEFRTATMVMTNTTYKTGGSYIRLVRD